jgi:hypothetical protein
LAVAFGITLFNAKNAGGLSLFHLANAYTFTDEPMTAVLEWVIAFGFTFYLLTFFYDLRLSKGVADGELTREKLREHPSLARDRA